MQAMDTPEPKKSPDWLVIEADYRAGIKPLRQIAEEHGITHGAVNKRAKRDEWTRDLGAKIAAQAEALVSKAAVSTEVSAAKKITEKAIVDAAANVQYTVRMEHRADIKRSRALFQSLLGELEAVGAARGRELLDALAESLVAEEGEDEDAARRRQTRNRKLLADIHALPGRIDSAKRLSEMLERLVRLEREAFGISNDDGGDSGRGSAKTVIVPAKDLA